MNKQEAIEEAINILKAAADIDAPKTTLKLELTKREVYVLKHTCRANIRVPNAVVLVSTDIGTNEVANLLDRIRREIGG